VRFHGAASRATGTERTKVRFEGNTLRDLLSEIKKRWPAVVELLEGKGVMVISLNGKALEDPDPTTKIRSEDILTIMPFVAGG
jgi:molybdopterin converting factor small subunit